VRSRLLCLTLVPAALCAAAEKVEILRDDFGVPHIFAATPAGAAFGSGYAQAEDRLEEMLRNYRKAAGTMAEVFGESYLEHDYRQRLWRHREVAEKNYGALSPESRAMCEAFIAGVARYMREHPREVPPWAPKLEPWFLPMLGRYIIWGWMQSEVGAVLLRAGIKPDPEAYRGSNEWLLAPARTAAHAPVALIDPHLSWYGEFRFYEIRLYAGKRAMSGAAVLGLPFPSLGHSRWASVAMTTGGPDTSDVFEEEIADGKYRFRDQWKPLEVRHEHIGVKTGDTVADREYTIEATGHGPIVAHKDGKAYSAAIPYANEFRLLEQMWRMMNARDLAEMKSALGMLELMPQNIMVGTVGGDIYYLRNGRVPIRPKGCDPSKPMPGAGACEWQGIHPLTDLIQVENPPSGYLENCNVAPEWLFKGSPFTPDKFQDRPYLYNARPGPPHQRAAEVLELLDPARGVTLEQAQAIAFSTVVYQAETWQDRVRRAAPEGGGFVRLILDWNRRADADSRGALAFYLFKTALGAAGKATEPAASVTDDQIREALRKAEAQLTAEFAPNAVFGTFFRAGRQGAARTYPVGGGTLTDAGMAMPRAVSYEKHGQEMLGHGGQTATQLVILTRPPKSFMAIPLGESDHPDSPHFDDQAGKLFSPSRMKPTYFLDRKELLKHLESTKRLRYPE
jgi:acyl-homoserine-lactone acylase